MNIGFLCIEKFNIILKKELLNTAIHLSYPATVINIMRYFMNYHKLSLSKHINDYIEIILKLKNNYQKKIKLLTIYFCRSLSFSHEIVKKICYTSASKALYFICKIFPNISFHKENQVKKKFIKIIIIY